MFPRINGDNAMRKIKDNICSNFRIIISQRQAITNVNILKIILNILRVAIMLIVSLFHIESFAD